MNRKLPNEFVFSLVSLALAIVIVHSVFVLHVRPVAEAIMTVDRERMLADPAYVSQRSIYIVIKDYEQEAEIILMLWALALMGYKALAQRIEQRALLDAPLKLPEGMKILPEDTREYARQIESLPPETRWMRPESSSSRMIGARIGAGSGGAAQAARAARARAAGRARRTVSRLQLVAVAV